MGLDVYLIEREKEERDNEREAQWNALWERKEAGEITAEEYEKLSDELPKYEHHPDVPSEKYGTTKLFNRRYLRSSYNDGGFNRAVPELIGEPGKDLYWVFEDLVSDDEYSIKITPESIPALQKAKARALELAEKLGAGGPNLRVESISAIPMMGEAEHLWSEPPTADQALAWYREQLEREDTSGGGWSNAKGMFMSPPGGTGLKVLGWVAGAGFGMSLPSFSGPNVHIIYELDESVTESYMESAEITAEFCDEALMLIERDGVAYIHWSS